VALVSDRGAAPADEVQTFHRNKMIQVIDNKHIANIYIDDLARLALVLPVWT
jgi:hypothetical protein